MKQPPKKTITGLLGMFIFAFFAGCNNTNIRQRQELSELRSDALIGRLSDLEARVNELESFKQRYESREKPFYERICYVNWDGQRFKPAFGWIRSLGQNEIGPVSPALLNTQPRGLAFAPDGRIGISAGQGTTPHMVMTFWDNAGPGESIVDIKYQKRSFEPADGLDWDSLERQGYFWFFAGPLAFDKSGTCYFSLGPCRPNGIYRVNSTCPVEIEKLCNIGSTTSLQIPFFDTDNIYATSQRGIYRYPLLPSNNTEPEPWFRIEGDGISMGHSLVVSPTKVIVGILIDNSQHELDRDFDYKTLCFNKDTRSFQVLYGDSFGPMAMSWDGEQLIRFDKAAGTITEFTLQ